MLTGINHITLAVSNITRSFNFYCEVLGFKPLCRWDQGAYFLVGDLWFCLNVDVNIKPDCIGYTHLAFSVSHVEFSLACERIIRSGAKVFKQNTSEGNSLYFLDPDSYKLEIHVGNWQTRLENKKKDLGSWKNVKWFE